MQPMNVTTLPATPFLDVAAQFTLVCNLSAESITINEGCLPSLRLCWNTLNREQLLLLLCKRLCVVVIMAVTSKL